MSIAITIGIVAALAVAWYYGTLTTYERYAAVMTYRRARDSGKLTKEAKSRENDSSRWIKRSNVSWPS